MAIPKHYKCHRLSNNARRRQTDQVRRFRPRPVKTKNENQKVYTIRQRQGQDKYRLIRIRHHLKYSAAIHHNDRDHMQRIDNNKPEKTKKSNRHCLPDQSSTIVCLTTSSIVVRPSKMPSKPEARRVLMPRFLAASRRRFVEACDMTMSRISSSKSMIS